MLPGGKQGASDRPAPEESFLNYKLGTHLSVTKRNQWYSRVHIKQQVDNITSQNLRGSK